MDTIAVEPRDLPLETRVRKCEEEIKPILEKWGIVNWAGLDLSKKEAITAIPMWKDIIVKNTETEIIKQIEETE